MPYFNFRKMTNLFQGAALIVACAALSACADAKWPNFLTGEPDDSIGKNRAGIERIDSQGAVWPNLNTVPPRPTPASPQAAREKDVNQLSKDRTDALKLLEEKKPTGETDNPVIREDTTKTSTDSAPSVPSAPPK